MRDLDDKKAGAAFGRPGKMFSYVSSLGDFDESASFKEALFFMLRI